MEYIDFGNTGLKVSRLSMGTGTNGWAHHSEQTDLGLEGLADLLRASYDLGINFWDTADQYGSHQHIAVALDNIPRDKVVIATKTNSHSGQAVARDVERFLRELQTDVLDIVLLHCISSENWTRRQAGAMEALSKAKEQGKIRAVGISCHGLGALRAAATSDWLDAILVRINFAGTRMDGSPTDVAPLIEQLHAAGKAVYGMKVLGCGSLVKDVRAAIQYVLQLGTVHALTIGISHQEHLRQSARLIEELAPLHPLRA
ncbi:MAG: aldo/keto reductase [Anaerolineae bacterium]|nr:MAG: aldo/keto reductase [Anaerolineae bacterium]